MKTSKAWDSWVDGHARTEGQSSVLLRLSEILAPHGPIPISKSTWYAGIRSGRFPQPIRLGKRISAWRSQDIQNLVDGGYF